MDTLLAKAWRTGKILVACYFAFWLLAQLVK